MRAQAVPVPILIESGVRFSWPQAVALVQAIVAVGGRRPPRLRGLDSLAGLALDPDGVVVTTSDMDPALSVSELALLLGRLLPGELTAPRDRAPAGLQFAVARALGLAQAPAFGSVREFSALLARFETGDRAALLRELFEQHLVHTMRMQARYAEELQTRSSSEPGALATGRGFADEGPPSEAERRVERRRSGIAPDVARRLLREADARAYADSRRRYPSADSHEPHRSTDSRRGYRSTDLRRDYRSTDLRRFAQITLGVLSALAVLIAAGAAGYYYRGMSPDPVSLVNRTQARVGTDGVAIAPTAAPLTPTPAAQSSDGSPPPARSRHAAAAATRPAPMMRKPARGPVVTPSHRADRAIAKSARPAPATVMTNDAPRTRRSAPVRLLSAVRRGFLRLFRRQSADALPST